MWRNVPGRGLKTAGHRLAAWAGMLIVAFVAFSATSAQAQTLVSNIGQTPNSPAQSLSSFDQAQGFTTGPDTYTLTSIAVKMQNTSGSDAVDASTISATVLSLNTLRPVATLTGSGSIPADSGAAHHDIVFTAPGDTTLDASATYFLILEWDGSAGNPHTSQTTSDDEDSGASSGWSIDDVSYHNLSEQAESTLMIRVSGAVPPPQLAHATVNGATLVLTFSTALDATSVPAAGDFSVTVDSGSPVAPSDVEVGGTTVTLTLATAVTSGQTVTVSYTPGVNPIQNGSGLEAPALADEAVANNTVELTDATVDGATLVLTFSTALDVTSVPAASDFSVKVDSGSPVAPTAVAISVSPGTTVTLTLATAVTHGQTVTVSYTPGVNPIRDGRSREAPALADEAVANNTFGLTHATVDGAMLVLTFSTALDATSEPAASDFSVTVDSTAAAPSAVAISGTTVTLTLATAVTNGLQTVTVSYTPGVNPIQDGSGREAPALTDEAVANNTVGLTGATVDGDTLVLTFSTALDGASVPVAGDFAVTVNNDSPVAPSAVAISGTTVTLTLATAVFNWQTVTVSYTPGANPIQDGSGRQALALTDETVTNNTPVPPPQLTGATVDGDTLVLFFNRALDGASVPVASDFSVTVDSGSPVAPSNVEVGVNTVTLTLATEVTNGQTVTVSYTPGTNPIQDASGIEAAALTDETVTNNTAVPSPMTPALVSNFGQTPDGGSAPSLDDLAQGFTTGPAGIYALTSIAVNMLNFDSTAAGVSTISATVVEDSPTGTLVATLTGSGSIPGDFGAASHDIVFTAPVGTRLAASTTYYLVLWGPSTGFPFAHQTSSDAEDMGGASGWSIGDTSFLRDRRSDGSFDEEDARSFMIRVSGSLLTPQLTDATVNRGTLVLTFSEGLHGAYVPALSDFSVTVDGGLPVAPSDVEVGGTTVTLTLATAVTSGQTVTVSYTPGTRPLQTGSGIEAAALTDETVTNNTVATNTDPTGAPVITGVPQVGETLTAGVGNIDDDDNLPTTTFPTGYSFQWVRVDSDGASNPVDIGGVRARTHR